jgi:hypothetical protein
MNSSKESSLPSSHSNASSTSSGGIPSNSRLVLLDLPTLENGTYSLRFPALANQKEYLGYVLIIRNGHKYTKILIFVVVYIIL